MKAAIFFLVMGAAFAQTEPNGTATIERSINGQNFNFQVVTTAGQNGMYLFAGGRAVKGRPFSATEDNKSLQVLGNGTRIESNTKRKLFRDVEGRARTEEADGVVTIFDPVAGFEATLNPKTKTATKRNGAGSGTFAKATAVRYVSIGNKGSELKEALGLQSMNGVTAHGERVTVTIPKGEIGNDRDLKVVNERWTSDDLQLLVKSTNSDPRYGDTSYELTGISLAAPDSGLFQIPSDYTVTEGGFRGSVSVAPRAVPSVPAVPGLPVQPAKPAARGGKQ
jgi:hypothetical protein